ncbi:MAG: hypothetical protein WCB57_13570, partial [Pseudonocardiaceae bacterium]
HTCAVSKTGPTATSKKLANSRPRYGRVAGQNDRKIIRIPAAGDATTDALAVAWAAEELPPGRSSRRFVTESQSSHHDCRGPTPSSGGEAPAGMRRYRLIALVAVAAAVATTAVPTTAAVVAVVAVVVAPRSCPVE